MTSATPREGTSTTCTSASGNDAPLLAAAAAVTVLALVLIGTAWTGTGRSAGGGVLSEADRATLASVPVQRGEGPAPADPAVDLADPEAVARAYLAAAYSVTTDDAGRTQLRAAAYAEPDGPAARVGGLVLDPPPAGSVRTAAVTALALVAADRGGHRRGYRAELGIATGPPGGALAVTLAVRDVVLVRQPDGRWLVGGDTTANPDLPAGED